MLPRTRRHLAGRPFALPPALDRLAEAWWRARPRTRVLAGIAVALLLLAAGIAHAASSPGGPPVRVWITTRDLFPGDTLTASDRVTRMWPRDLVPAGALEQPAGVVTAPLPRGAVVTDRHIGDHGLSASVPIGHVAVSVPVEQLPAMTPGTHVDLVGVGQDGNGALLAADAIVVHEDDHAVWFAVDPAVSVDVSVAAASARLAVIVRPP